MVTRNIDKEFQINTDFLDTIDFIPFLSKYERLGKMKAAIEKIYNNSNMPKELQGYVFNYYSEYDFKNYLLNRYPNVSFYSIEDYLIDYKEGEKYE